MNQVIGITTGVFDILHAGHLDFLANADRLCDHLVVFVNEISSKGECIFSAEMRKYMVKQIRAVDEAILFKDEEDLIYKIKDKISSWSTYCPLFIKGNDYTFEGFSEPVQRLLLEQRIPYCFVPTFNKKEYSSSVIKEKMKNSTVSKGPFR